MGTETSSWRSDLRKRVANSLWALTDPHSEEWPADLVADFLSGHLHASELSTWLESAVLLATRPVHEFPEPLDSVFPDSVRRQNGIYFTPKELAARMASWASADDAIVLDPAAGDGALLVALHRQHPNLTFHAIDRDIDLAIALVARMARLGADIEVWVGDGLDESVVDDVYDLVVMNPPYLGEKGNRETFADLRRRHVHLADAFTPRVDLSNLFLFSGLDRLADGGRLIALTSEYWLQSDSARPIRRKIAGHFGLVALERFGSGLFADAPGHHSLITVVGREEKDSFRTNDDGEVSRHDRQILDGDRWNPFVPSVARNGVPLGQVVKTSQGFVSGADRVTPRHLRIAPGCGEVGDPIFVWDTEPPSELAPHVEPILRASQLVGGEVIESFDPVAWVIWIDGEFAEGEGDAVLEHLRPFRPILGRRREARKGTMPWYRLHWPRNRDEMARPKLVTPRRAPAPTFDLDLTGSPVSSDCTFIIAPTDVEEPVAWLLDLQRELQSEEVEKWLRRNGKTKGGLIEFYAGPLEALPVPARFSKGETDRFQQVNLLF